MFNMILSELNGTGVRQTMIHPTKNRGTDMRTMSAEKFSGYEGLKFAQPQAAWADTWNTIIPLLQSGAIKPIVAKTFPLAEAAHALRYLVEGRPFGRVVLTS
jgi:NADPH:quinone reductase-like Zn-dependent oxidoreductase